MAKKSQEGSISQKVLPEVKVKKDKGKLTSVKGKVGKGKFGNMKVKEPQEKELFTHFGNKIFNYKFEEQDLDVNTFLKFNVIGILFTGTWVPPAKEFMEKLTQLYKEVNANEKVFEIVQISNEKNEKSYKEAITEERPWLYLPFNDAFIPNLIEKYKVEYLPTFIIVNRDLFILSKNGRKDMIDNEGIKAYEFWYKAYRTRKEAMQKEKEDKDEHEDIDDNGYEDEASL